MQAMYDLVGDKIQEIFDAQVVDIGIYDLEAELIHYPYAIEKGQRIPDEAVPIRTADAGPPARAARRASRSSSTNVQEFEAEIRHPLQLGSASRPSRSCLPR